MNLSTISALAISVSPEKESVLTVSNFYARRFKTINQLKEMALTLVNDSAERFRIKDVGASSLEVLEYRLKELVMEEPEFVYIKFWHDTDTHPEHKEIMEAMRKRFRNSEILTASNQ